MAEEKKQDPKAAPIEEALPNPEKMEEEGGVPPVVEETWEKPKHNILLLGLLLANFIFIIVIYFNQQKLALISDQYINDYFIVPGENKTKSPTENLFTYKLQPISANLAVWNGPRRFLKMTAILELVPGSSTRDELKIMENEIRNELIIIINNKNPEDLLSPQGSQELKNEFMKAINSVLKTVQIQQIYYEDFRVN